MLKIAQLSAAALALTAAFGAAHAGINDDIDSCRVAIDEAGLMGDETYRLKFVSDQGNRNRVLKLEAVVVGSEDRLIDCRMKRSDVVEVVFADS